jgi:hypothetical protein
MPLVELTIKLGLIFTISAWAISHRGLIVLKHHSRIIMIDEFYNACHSTSFDNSAISY